MLWTALRAFEDVYFTAHEDGRPPPQHLFGQSSQGHDDLIMAVRHANVTTGTYDDLVCAEDFLGVKASANRSVRVRSQGLLGAGHFGSKDVRARAGELWILLRIGCCRGVACRLDWLTSTARRPEPGSVRVGYNSAHAGRCKECGMEVAASGKMPPCSRLITSDGAVADVVVALRYVGRARRHGDAASRCGSPRTLRRSPAPNGVEGV